MHKKAAVSQKVRTAAFILVTKIHSRPFQRRLFCDTRFAAVANVLKIRESQLEHDAVLEDGDLAEAVLLGLGLLTAGNADDQIQQVLCGLVDGLFAVSDNAGVEVDPARLLLCQRGVGRNLQGGSRSGERRAAAGGRRG